MIAPHDVDVLVLCGGKGERLQSVLRGGQKTMVEVGGAPFLDILVDWAAQYGFRRFVFCTGHEARSVESHFALRKGLEMSFSREEEPLGTGGAVKGAAGRLRGPATLILNGDSYCPVDLAQLLRFHARHGDPATMVVVEALRADGGFITLGPDGRVTAFNEKRPAASGFLNAGVYVFSQAALAEIPPGRSSLERDVFPVLASKGALRAYEASEKLWDIGTPERLEAFRRQRAPHV